MKVSIIIPAYNYAKFLPETLNSIIHGKPLDFDRVENRDIVC